MTTMKNLSLSPVEALAWCAENEAVVDFDCHTVYVEVVDANGESQEDFAEFREHEGAPKSDVFCLAVARLVEQLGDEVSGDKPAEPVNFTLADRTAISLVRALAERIAVSLIRAIADKTVSPADARATVRVLKALGLTNELPLESAARAADVAGTEGVRR